ncbi:MAG: hypothetical protein IJE08_14660 [Clostridia bacterium]|nr:hypothetical protein [Clostridia bacterium]
MTPAQTRTLEDEHLDLMLRLAYRRAAGEEICQLIDESARPLTACEEEQLKTGYALFLQKLAAQAGAKKPARKRRRFAYLIEAAACIVLALGISMSVAVANVDVIRSKLLELIIELNDDHAAVSLQPVEDAVFEVPAGYMGDYYLTLVPDGYELNFVSMIYPEVRYVNAQKQIICFGEAFTHDTVSISAENAIYSTVSINGIEAIVIEEPPRFIDGERFRSYSFDVIWSIDDRFFYLTCQESKELAIELASSVRKIVR